MLILGTSILGADFSYSPTPTSINNLNEVTIQGAIFDTLLISSDTKKEETYDIDTTWGRDSILIAKFEKDLSAGNINWTLANTSDILIQKRIKGEFEWTTVAHKTVEKIEDFNLTFIDPIIQNHKTYEYSCVNMLNNVENGRDTREVYVDFNAIFISDSNVIYGTDLDTGYCDTTRNNYAAIKKELPLQKYPFTHSFASTNYDSGDMSGFFAKFDNNCEIEITESVQYRREFMDWLTNGKAKILKHFDGRTWMINIDGSPTDSADGHWIHRIISFNWYESGDYTSELDLYESGLIDVTSNFWAKSYSNLNYN